MDTDLRLRPTQVRPGNGWSSLQPRHGAIQVLTTNTSAPPDGGTLHIKLLGISFVQTAPRPSADRESPSLFDFVTVGDVHTGLG